MSDFVSRVAARAVGRAASAQPRLPALFEPAGPGPGGVLEVVEETVAPRRASARRAEAAPAQTRRQAPVAAATEPTPRTAAQPPDAVAEPRVAEPGRAVDEVLAEAAVPAEGAEEFVLARPVPAAAPVEPEPPGAEPVPQTTRPPAAGPVVAAQRVAREAPLTPPPAAALAPAAAATAEQPAVRVHIGRLEVRATLETPAAPQRGRERPRPAEVSLGDYLRGRRTGS